MFKFISVKECAIRCGVSEAAIRKAIKTNRIRATKIEYAWVVREWEVFWFKRKRSYQRGRKSNPYQRKGKIE